MCFKYTINILKFYCRISFINKDIRENKSNNITEEYLNGIYH